MREDLIPAAVSAVIRRYARRSAWIEAMELQQQAVVIMAEAARTWKPGPVPLASYQAAAVARQLGRYIAAQASPVHETHGQLSGARGCDLEALEHVGATPCPERLIDIARACAEVRRILAARSVAARAVLLEERKPAEVASAMGLSVRAVYVEVNAAMRGLRASRQLARLAEAAL